MGRRADSPPPRRLRGSCVASVWVLHRDIEGTPRRILESNTDVTERKSAEQRLRSPSRPGLHLLNDITRAIGERHDLASIFQVVVVTLRGAVSGGPVLRLPVCPTGHPEFTVTSMGAAPAVNRYRPRSGLSEHGRIDIDRTACLTAWAVSSSTSRDLKDVPFPFPRGGCQQAGLGAFVGTPLIIEKKVFGVLIAARRCRKQLQQRRV